MARRKFTVEFRKSAVQLVRQQGYSVPEAARSLGVDAALRSENQRLRKANAQLRMEREILKKAATFFAKDQP
jgi:transposase